MGKNEILSALSDYKKQSAAKYGIIAIGIFGSFARDEAKVDSDIDIFVETSTPNPFVLVHIKQEVESLLDHKVDIIRLRDSMNTLLKDRIKKEGVYV